MTALESLDSWVKEGVFTPTVNSLDPANRYAGRRAEGVEKIVRAMRVVAQATAEQPYEHVRHVKVLEPFSQVGGFLLPDMVSLSRYTARQLVTLELPIVTQPEMRHSFLFGPRGRYGLNAVVLDRRENAELSRVSLHISDRPEFVPYASVNKQPTQQVGQSYVWATISTNGTMKFDRVSCGIDPRKLLEASLGRRPGGDVLAIWQDELDPEALHPGFALQFGADLPLLGAYLKEVAQFLSEG